MVGLEGYYGNQVMANQWVNSRVLNMVNRSGKRRPLPPSRERYQQSHPTVSLRVDLDLYAQLKALKQKANLSVADVLKIGLERCGPLVDEAFRNGFMGGLAEAYQNVCDTCEGEVMAIAIAQGAEPDLAK